MYESVPVPDTLVVRDTVGDMLRVKDRVLVTLSVGLKEGVKLPLPVPHPEVEAQ